ncbi:hypothetical protein CVIRNUC_010004 [Coccomyxa viridis]|uniref:Carbohydrate kinase PfkB domain-containing protein n=1 Tax=Coccomyxa viridis TaxID=1274662 RepID=A0AAV1IK07_9CHLO|nr:hypothetical protein CVIRNUC_010004 [Coccomyxa viridis]
MGSGVGSAAAHVTLSLCKRLLPLLIVSVFLLTLSEVFRPALLLVGDVTVDVVEGRKAVGGAIAYAAAVANAYGTRACVVTAAGPDADLAVFKGHELHVVPTNSTLTFEHSYTWWGNKRKLRVTASPNMTLTMQHVPQHCRRARTILLGPLTPRDLDAASFISFKQGLWDRLIGFKQQVGLMAQGQQRGLDPTGKVFAFREPSQQLLDAVGPRTSVFLSDVETDSWRPGLLDELAAKSARWLITRGEFGAHEYMDGNSVHLPPEKVAAVDTNGAGDTFATAYMLALARHARSPGADANWVASRAVMHEQACKPQCVLEGIVLGSSYAQYRQWLRGQVDSARHRIGAMAASLGPFGNETQQAFAAFMTSYTLGRGKRQPNGTAGAAVGPSGLEGYAAAFNGSQKLLNAALAKLRSKFAAQ